MTTSIQYALFNEPVDPSQVDPRDAWLFEHPFKTFDEGESITRIQKRMAMSVVASVGSRRKIGEFKLVEVRVVLRESYVLRTPFRNVENP